MSREVTDLQPDEVIDITIRGARVVEQNGGRLTYAYTTTGGDAAGFSQATVDAWADSVTIRRVLPAAGMPQAGDLWQDADGCRYLAVPYDTGVRLTAGFGNPMTVEVLSASRGPLTLIYRDQTDGGEGR